MSLHLVGFEWVLLRGAISVCIRKVECQHDIRAVRAKQVITVSDECIDYSQWTNTQN
jgi:hypothetical protein